MTRLRLGIVGVGRHGSRYARHAARDVDTIELVAVCRRDEVRGREIAAALDCDYERDALDLVARPDIDAVVLVTVPNLLERIVEQAAWHGKHLLIEKPVAPDVATGERIAEMIEAAGVYCVAGHTLRFNSVCRSLRELVPELGRLDTLVFTQRFPPQLAIEWLDDPEQSGGGNILHTGVHCFDLIRFLSGLDVVTAACSVRSIYTKRTEDSFVSTLELSSEPTMAMVSCSRSTSSRNGLIEISGEHGQLVGDHVLNTIYRLTADGRTDVDPGPPRHTVLELLKHFEADLRAGRPPAVSYRDGLAAVAVAEACYRAARSGARERVAVPGRAARA
ncbi:MAG: gfo/Idh/MocA family oxidoreductase [Deltaproteobacteria bacterium]|nr:MAG: gfo/Idh/MocA family oxidoreductase [Deltaproteobacteria bacterium]